MLLPCEHLSTILWLFFFSFSVRYFLFFGASPLCVICVYCWRSDKHLHCSEEGHTHSLLHSLGLQGEMDTLSFIEACPNLFFWSYVRENKWQDTSPSIWSGGWWQAQPCPLRSDTSGVVCLNSPTVRPSLHHTQTSLSIWNVLYAGVGTHFTLALATAEVAWPLFFCGGNKGGFLIIRPLNSAQSHWNHPEASWNQQQSLSLLWKIHTKS